MVTSEFLSVKYQEGPFGEILRGDPGRIAAQAITGIGFLGAGVTLRYKETIRGLTKIASVMSFSFKRKCRGINSNRT